MNSPFVPTLPAALFASDCVAAAVLFARFSLLRQWALLVIASGDLFTPLRRPRARSHSRRT